MLINPTVPCVAPPTPKSEGCFTFQRWSFLFDFFRHNPEFILCFAQVQSRTRMPFKVAFGDIKQGLLSARFNRGAKSGRLDKPERSR